METLTTRSRHFSLLPRTPLRAFVPSYLRASICSVALAATASASEPATAPVKRQDLSLTTVHGMFASSVTLTGRVQALTSAKIGPSASGRLAEFASVDGQSLDVGMSVKKGQVLFTLDQERFENQFALASAQLESAKAALANLVAPMREEKLEQIKQDVVQLEARAADKARERDRYRRLVELEKTLPPRRLEEVEVELTSLQAQKKAAEARLQEAVRGPTPTEVAMASARVKEAEAAVAMAKNELKESNVVAPSDGMITQRYKSVGDYLVNMPPTEVLELVSMDKLEAEIAVPESYMPALAGNDAKVTLKSPLLKTELVLPVTRVVAHVDAARGTFAVRVRIPPEQRGLLTAGAFVTAELPLSNSSSGVIAPSRGIISGKDGAYTYVARDGKIVRQAVSLGDKLSEGVVVSAGLKDGDILVIGPAEQLTDGQPLPEYLQ